MAVPPADVLTIILSYLPVKSLLQFRSISKSWRFIIDSNHFKTLHLNNFHKLNSKLILRKNSKLYVVDLPTPGNAVHLNQPLKLNECDTVIIGSCNGLLCIKNLSDDIAIANPSLRKQWIIPYLPSIDLLFTHNNRFYACVYGFGFDSFTGDYKLVKISYFIILGCSFEPSFVSKVNLFSCRTNVWKTLPNMPYALSWFITMGVFVDHAVHWVVTKNREFDCPKLIVAFDLRLEVFNELPLPKLGEHSKIELSQLGGCLTMVVDYFENSRIDFWVMKQYGSKDGWFKLFTWVECLELRSPLRCVKPLGYSSDGMKVLIEQDVNKLIWYDFKSKQVSPATNPGMPNFDEAVIWVESFVQPPFPSQKYRKRSKYNTSRRCLRS